LQKSQTKDMSETKNWIYMYISAKQSTHNARQCSSSERKASSSK